jgi:hypothetical protein
MVYPGTGRHQEERTELAINWKGKVVGRKERLETLSIGPYKMGTI